MSLSDPVGVLSTGHLDAARRPATVAVTAEPLGPRPQRGASLTLSGGVTRQLSRGDS
jgi:hypothetical protein